MLGGKYVLIVKGCKLPGQNSGSVTMVTKAVRFIIFNVVAIEKIVS